MGKMKTVALVPIKLNNQRLPGKNLAPLGGKPLLRYILDTLRYIDGIDNIYVYCSDKSIQKYIPEGIAFLKRDSALDRDTVKGLEIYRAFQATVDADVYLVAHATSPFIKAESIQTALNAVLSGAYDSAFAARDIHTFAWYGNKPLNYNLSDIPRTQDIEPVIVETSAFYIFRKEVLTLYNRRIGYKPYVHFVDEIEAVDIDYPDDLQLAEAIIRRSTPPPPLLSFCTGAVNG
jgi:CMP-N-acetylneuraminic acid synthetase